MVRKVIEGLFYTDDELSQSRVLIGFGVLVGLLGLVLALTTRHYVLAVLVLAVPVAAQMTRRSLRARAIRRANLKMARDKTRWPRLLANTLKPDEEVAYEARMHPIVIFAGKWLWLLLCTAALIASIVLQWWIVSPVALVVFGVITVPGAIDWYFTRRCFTDRRVIVVTGIFIKSVKAVQLDKIEVVSHVEEDALNKVLQLFGVPEVWHWEFDTLAQNDPFNDLRWCKFPSPVGDLLEQYNVQSTDE